MAETKIYISDSLDRSLREAAMRRFGFGKGSISSAATESITQWLAREDLIRSGLDSIVSIARGDKNAVAVILFGSYARKEPNYRDVDVAILLKHKSAGGVASSFAYKGEAGGLFDISVLNDLPIELQSRALDEGVVLYSKDNELLYDFSARTASAWDDFRRTVKIGRS